MLNYYSHQTIAVFWRATTYKSNLIKEKKTHIIKLNFASTGTVMNLKSWKNSFLHTIEDSIPCIFSLYEYKWKNFNKKHNTTFVNYPFRTLMTESISVIKPWLYDLKACYYWITLKSTSDVRSNRSLLFVC